MDRSAVPAFTRLGRIPPHPQGQLLHRSEERSGQQSLHQIRHGDIMCMHLWILSGHGRQPARSSLVQSLSLS
eukprot:705180-Pelagomonas_calceolata.AAC.1